MALNMIENALRDATIKIPHEILELTFQRTDYYGRVLPISIETKIRELVIEDRVLRDTNIVGGEQILIDMSAIVPDWYEPPYSAVYRIPKAITRGKSITKALSIAYGNMAVIGNGYQAQYNTSTLMDGANQVLQSHMNIPMVSTASIELIGENVIYVRDTISIPSMLWLRAIIENDENLNNIDIRYAKDFSALTVLALKAHIYHSLNIKLDLGQLHGGMNLGKIREVVDSYADADEMYETFIEEQWRKQTIMADHESMSRHLRMTVGGGH